MATTALFLLGKSNGQRSQEGYSQWGHKEWDTTEHSASSSLHRTRRCRANVPNLQATDPYFLSHQRQL